MSINNRPKLNRLLDGITGLPLVHGDYYRPADRIIDILHSEGFTGDLLSQILTTPSILTGLIVTLNADTTKLDITAGIAVGYDSQLTSITEHDYNSTPLSPVVDSAGGFVSVPRFINVTTNLTAVTTTGVPNLGTGYVKLRFKDLNLLSRNTPTDPAGTAYSFLTRDSYELIIDNTTAVSTTDVLLATFTKDAFGAITLSSGTGTRDVDTGVITPSGIERIPVKAGAAISANAIVYVSADDSANARPTVTTVSTTSQPPIGYAESAITSGASGVIVSKGRIKTTLNASAASVGDPVYCSTTGTLTLTATRFRIGSVVTNTTNAVVYFNFTHVDLQLPSGSLLLPGGNNLTLNNGSLSGTQTYTLQNRSMTIAATDEQVKASAAISVGDIVTITGDDSTNGCPTVAKISSPTQPPFGIALSAIASAALGTVTRYGRVTTTLNTTASVIGAPVFVTSTGTLTLTYGKYRIGTVESLAANGVVFFDFTREILDISYVDVTAGAAITAGSIVRISADDSTNLRPTVTTITASTQFPFGYAYAAIANASAGNVITYGRVTTTLNASTASVGDAVYCSTAGALTLVKTDFRIGTVITNTVNSIVFFDFTNVIPQSSLVNTGTIIAGAFTTVPSGFLLCNGASLSTTTYASLFAVIGYTYGGAGATFNIPDTQGAFLRSAGTSVGYATNVTIALGAKTDDAMQSHTHSYFYYDVLGPGAVTFVAGAQIQGVTSTTGGASGRTATETRVKSVAVNYFIKF